MPVQSLAVEVIDTLKRAARAGPILIDRAPIVTAEELAPAIHVRKNTFQHDSISTAHRHVDRKRRELSHFMTAQDGGIRMPVLLAASGGALLAGTGSGDRDSNRPHVTPPA